MKTAITKKIVFLVVLAALVFMPFKPALAKPSAEFVSGILAQDTTWGIANSPYYLSGDVQVLPGVTLTVEPGVEVYYPVSYELLINGSLIANGTSAQPIIFSGPGAAEATLLHYTGANLSTSQLSYVQFKNAAYAIRLSSGNSGTLSVTHAQITNSKLVTDAEVGSAPLMLDQVNLDGVTVRSIYPNGGPITLDHATIQNSTLRSDNHPGISLFHSTVTNSSLLIGDWSGLHIESSSLNNAPIQRDTGEVVPYAELKVTASQLVNSPIDLPTITVLIDASTIQYGSGTGVRMGMGTITASTITGDSTGIGVELPYSSGTTDIQNSIITHNAVGIRVRNDRSPITIQHSTLSDNASYHIENLSTSAILATYNNWGTTDLAQIAQKLFDYEDDNSKGKIDFSNPIVATPTPTAIPTDTPTPTATYTLTPTPTVTSTPTPTYTPTSAPCAPVTGSGLLGKYYAYDGTGGNANWANMVYTRIDPTIDFNWGSGSPNANIPVDNFHVRWTGKVYPPYPGSYTFYTQADAGTRLTIDTGIDINNWVDQAPTIKQVTLDLACGAHDIQLDYFESTGGAVMKLGWYNADLARDNPTHVYIYGSSTFVAIPSIYLVPPVGTLQPTSTYVTPTPTRTLTRTNTPNVTKTFTRTLTRTNTPSPTLTRTPSPTLTRTSTPTLTHTYTCPTTETGGCLTLTSTSTDTPTPTLEGVIDTYTPTPTVPETLTLTPTPTLGAVIDTYTPTPTVTLTPTHTVTTTPTVTPTLTNTLTLTPTPTLGAVIDTYTPTQTLTRTITRTNTPSPTSTRTLTPTSTLTLPPVDSVVIAIAPGTLTTGTGQTFSVSIRVQAGQQPVDSVAAYLNFDPSVLQIVSIAPGTILPVVIQNQFDNALGTLDFSAGTFSNFPTGSFDLATLTLRAVRPSVGSPLAFNHAVPRASDSAYQGRSIFERAEDGLIVIANAVLRGSVNLQGRPLPPHARWVTDLTISLIANGESTPRYTFTTTSDERGYFTLSDIQPGVYDVYVKNSHTLQNKVTVTLTNGDNTVDFGTLREGDVNNDNSVSLLDFSLLVQTYNKCQGIAGYNDQADFNRDGCVTLLDFSRLASNYGKGGDAILQRAAIENLLGHLSSGNGVTLRVDPPISAIAPGQVFTVTLEIQAGSQAIDAAQASLDFDPKFVTVQGIVPGTALPVTLTNQFDNQSGTLNYVAGAFSNFPSGTFTLAQVRLKAVAPVGESTLKSHFDNLRNTDATFNGASVLAGHFDGVIRIQTPATLPAATATLNPVPATRQPTPTRIPTQMSTRTPRPAATITATPIDSIPTILPKPKLKMFPPIIRRCPSLKNGKPASDEWNYGFLVCLAE